MKKNSTFRNLSQRLKYLFILLIAFVMYRPVNGQQLAVPGNVTATATSNSVTVNWGQVSNATGYVVNLCTPATPAGDINAILETTNAEGTTPSSYFSLTTGDRLYTAGSSGNSTTSCKPAGYTGTVNRTASGDDFRLELVTTSAVTTIKIGGRSSGATSDRTLASYSINGGAAQTAGITGKITGQGCTTEITISGLTLNIGDKIAFSFGANVQISYFILTSTGAAAHCTEYPVVGGSTTSHAVTGLAPTTTYSYQVKATNGVPADESAFSTSANITTLRVPTNATITLSSAAGTAAQSVAVNTAITSITYTYKGAFNDIVWTGTANASTAPNGITVNTATAGTLSISGTPTAVGSYGYTVNINGLDGGTNANSTGTITVTGATGINKYSKEISFSLYPNPALNTFQLDGIEGNATVLVSDLNGKTLLTKEIIGNERVDIDALTQGTYMVKVITEAGTSTKLLHKTR